MSAVASTAASTVARLVSRARLDPSDALAVLDPVLDLPPPPAVLEIGGPEPVTDLARSDRVFAAMQLFAMHVPRQEIVRRIAEVFEVTEVQALRDLADVRGAIRRTMNDQGNIYAAQFAAIAQHRLLAAEFLHLALAPVPETTEDVDGEGNVVERPLTVAEKAKVVQAKAAAAKVASEAIASQQETWGRRSPEWAKIPAVILQAAEDVLPTCTPEQEEALRRLRGEP